MKEIPITDLLTHLGHRPVSRAKGGRQWFYHSPLREDNNASFCVSSDKNLWYDFGTSRGGNVIDLARALNGDCSFKVAASWLEEQRRGFKQGPPLAASLVSNGPLRPDTEMENIQVLPLARRSSTMSGTVISLPFASRTSSAGWRSGIPSSRAPTGSRPQASSR